MVISRTQRIRGRQVTHSRMVAMCLSCCNLTEKAHSFMTHDMILAGGRTNSDASAPFEASTSGIIFDSVTEYIITTTSSTLSSVADSTIPSDILASGHSLTVATSTWTPPNTTTTTPTSVSQSPDEQNVATLQHPISSGAMAGLVVGVVVFILLAMASATLCWRHRRRTTQITASELPSHQTDAEIKAYPSATIWIPELGQDGAMSGPHELAVTPTPLAEPLGLPGAAETQLADEGLFEIVNPK